MVKIVATEEQIRQLMESKESVEFVDTAGNRIGSQIVHLTQCFH